MFSNNISKELSPKGGRRKPLASAQDALAMLSAGSARPIKRGARAENFPIGQALLYELKASRPSTTEKDPRRWTRYNRDANVMLKLNAFWGSKTIGEVNGNVDVSADYDRFRQESRGNAKPLAGATLETEKSLLRHAIKRFIKDNDLSGSVDIPTTAKIGSSPRTALSRQQLARLLWAARGRRWDTTRECWHPSPPWNRQNPYGLAEDPKWVDILRKKRCRKHAARTILLCAYTASLAGCMTRLRWTGSPDGENSYVNLDHHPALLYRLGRDTAAGKLAGKPVFLNRRITAHLKRWRDLDAKSHCLHVIHFLDKNRAMTYVPNQVFRSIVADAGLPATLKLDHLSFSAARHIAKTQGMVLRSGALLQGILTARFLKLHAHLAGDFQQSVIDALTRKPGKDLIGLV